MVKKRLLRIILVVDGVLLFAYLCFHSVDQWTGVPSTSAIYCFHCSVSSYDKFALVATIILDILFYGWVTMTLPVVLVVLAQWLGITIRRQKRNHLDPSHRDV